MAQVVGIGFAGLEFTTGVETLDLLFVTVAVEDAFTETAFSVEGLPFPFRHALVEHLQFGHLAADVIHAPTAILIALEILALNQFGIVGVKYLPAPMGHALGELRQGIALIVPDDGYFTIEGHTTGQIVIMGDTILLANFHH